MTVERFAQIVFRFLDCVMYQLQKLGYEIEKPILILYNITYRHNIGNIMISGKRHLNIIAVSVSSVAFFASCFVIFYSGDADDVARQRRIITIPQGQGHVAAASQPVSQIVPIQPDSGKPTSAQNFVEQVRRTYPMLSDVEVRCEPDRCILLGTPGRPATPEEQDARQQMLLGGLSSFLAANGYEPSGPIEMDEIGDEEYRIRLPLSRNAQAIAAAAGGTSG